MFFVFFSCLLVFILGIKKNNNTQFDAHCILEHLVSSMERLEVNIWKYEAPLCVCVSLSLSLHVYVCVCVCFQMIKWGHRAAGEPTPTWGPCGEVPDLAKEEQEALSKAPGTTKTSAAQRTPQREKKLSFKDKTAASVSLFVPHSWGSDCICSVGNLK